MTEEPAKQDVFKKHLNDVITSAGFLKVIIKDKKTALRGSQSSLMKVSKQPVGVGCLGTQYIFAHDFYYNMGDYYFSMATTKGVFGILPAVKKCFLIAGQNLKAILDVVDNEQKKSEYMVKFNKTLSFAESVQ